MSDPTPPDHEVEEVISKLLFVSRLQPGEKIDVSSLSVQPNTYAVQLYRTILARGESRVTTLDFIRQTLDEAFELARAYSERTDPYSQRVGRMLIDALASAKTGIVSLTETYKDDRMFVSRVETLAGTLEAKIADLD
jgi:hypothetical protein